MSGKADIRKIEQLNKYHGIQVSIFLPVVSCRPNMGVSEGCLDGVWRCLTVSGSVRMVSEGVRQMIAMCDKLKSVE